MKTIYFEPAGDSQGKISVLKNVKIDSINTFGFIVSLKSNKLLVKYIFNNSSADLHGIQLDDQIIKINDIDYTDIDKNCYCEIIEKGILSEYDTISVSVLRNNQELDFTLSRNPFILCNN